jgi:RHS repeat-associated protein
MQLRAPNRSLLYKRARYYDNQTGEFVSRDPLALEQDENGYEDGMSLYRGYFVPNDVDPSGNVVVSFRKRGAIAPKCGPPIFAQRRYAFEISGNWPCESREGVFVQKVTVHCLLADCKNLTYQDSFFYFEAFKTRRVRDSSSLIADWARFGTEYPRSSYRQNGIIKFFCLPPKNEVPEKAKGEIDFAEIEDWPTDAVFGNGGLGLCRTDAGGLHATTSTPSFWSMPSADGVTANRRFSMFWNCCCPKKYAFWQFKP